MKVALMFPEGMIKITICLKIKFLISRILMEKLGKLKV